MKRTMISLALVVLFASCKKENDEQPFSAPGLWEGNIYLYNTTLLLRANGTTRLFMGTSNGDTSQCANPPINGTYTVNGRTFRAEYGDPNGIDVMILKAESVSGITMKGAMTNSSGVYTDFQFTKKQ
jgi:hypothetical protein